MRANTAGDRVVRERRLRKAWRVASFQNLQGGAGSLLLGFFLAAPGGCGKAFTAVPHLNLKNFLVLGARLAANAVLDRRPRALLQPFLQRRLVVRALQPFAVTR